MVFAPSNRVGLLHPTPDRDPPRFENKPANMNEPYGLCLNLPAMRVEPLEEFPLLTAASLSPVTVAFMLLVPAPCEQGGNFVKSCVDIDTPRWPTPWEFSFKALLRKQVRNHQPLLPAAVVLSFHGLCSPSRPDRREPVAKLAATHKDRSPCDTVPKSPGRLPCDSVPERRSHHRLTELRSETPKC